jgi:hypothetical protein
MNFNYVYNTVVSQGYEVVCLFYGGVLSLLNCLSFNKLLIAIRI